ncbi:hypothetical protein [Arcticibacterium luteifluviistationis]|uniref:DUF4890 domain-containing protein n=1 Tax=Arcticibacterium luteifluviistationis TaxID=1784714 RepID=A0A2Z4GCA1_9BACT|nr:hypothetical protein [Arcticibacterium luteifluviistationis]AWV98801.1 hypothetical protein DJ013_11705 [Arcticibacterium luteifluviistationis]
MKKLITLIAVMTMIVSTSMAQYKSKSYKGGDIYASNKYSKNYGNNNKSNAREINSFQRQARESIAQGIVAGTINSNEAKRLLVVAEKIEAKENKYLRNGRLTSRESNELKKDIDSLNKMIRREKNDRDVSNVDRNNRYSRGVNYRR